jgi:hypothetical protein
LEPLKQLRKETTQRSLANLEDELAKLAAFRNALRAIWLSLEATPTSKKRWN